MIKEVFSEKLSLFEFLTEVDISNEILGRNHKRNPVAVQIL